MKQRKTKKHFEKDLRSKVLLGVLALCVSGLLILSMPILSAVVKGDIFKKKEKRTTQVLIKKIDLNKPKDKPKKESKRPKRSKPNHRSIKSGPRFAMNLDVAGAGGADISLDLVNKSRGSGEFGAGDVDKKPSPVGRLEMDVPDKVSEMEVDAEVTLGFCVDVSGKAYEIRVLNEDPVGVGMAQGGIAAIQSALFEPAIANAEPVAFCGVEKEFVFKFSE